MKVLALFLYSVSWPMLGLAAAAKHPAIAVVGLACLLTSWRIEDRHDP